MNGRPHCHTAPLRVGLVGIGPHARENLIPALRNNARTRIAAVSSRSEERANEYAARYGADEIFLDWRRLVASEAVDAVVVSGPPDLHASVARMCLETGIHVFVEKPPARDTTALDELILLSKRHKDVVTFVDYSFRFGATYKTLLDALAPQGSLAAARIRCVSSKPRDILWDCRSIERSFLLAVGIHPIEMLIDLFGNVERVDGSHVRFAGDRFSMDLTLMFSSGALGSLQFGNYSTRFEYDVELITTSGATGTLDAQHTIRLSGMDTGGAGLALGPKSFVAFDWPSLHGGYALGGYQGAIDAFVNEVLDGGPPSSPLRNSATVLHTIDAILDRLGGERET